MKCPQCGKEIGAEAAFCPFCGVSPGFTAELIRRAGENDQAAIEELYERTYGSVYATVRALVKDEDTALDILQDSYLKAFRSLDRLQEPEKFQAWIKRIAHNRAVDVLRQRKELAFSDLETEETDAPLDFEDDRPDRLPEVSLDRQETARLLGEILDSLPADQRTAISLFYYEQLSVREIAEELGVSENTVKSRLNYGRKKIEARVRELEKKGTKLYGLAPLPFLQLLFRSGEAAEASAPLLGKITAGLALRGSAGSVGSAAAGTAGKAAARAAGAAGKAAGAALRTRIIAGAAAAVIAIGGGTAVYRGLSDRPAAVEREQILPRDFLLEMEALSEEKLGTVLEDNDWLELCLDSGTLDVPPDRIRIEDPRLLKDAVFYETGGVTTFYLCYQAEVRLAEDWAGVIVTRVATDYPEAVVVFTLDTFPLKFLREDGSIVYDREDLRLYRIYPDLAAFRAAVKEEVRYVSHKRYDIRLP